MERRLSAELIEEMLPLKGASVVDVGCGDGWLVRSMTRKGAHVTGVEVSPNIWRTPSKFPPAGDEHYIQGIAEDLPIPTRSVDIVIFFNSLHHVDEPGLFKALREAARVLKSGGILFVSEPSPEGPYFETMKPVHDETAVRRRAQEALRYGPEFGLLLEKSLTYIDTVKMKDFNAFHDRLTMINPHVRDRFEEKEEELRALFGRNARKIVDGWIFDQPMRVHLMRRS